MPDLPELPSRKREREFGETLERMTKERAEAVTKRKKAFLDGAAFGIALLAAAFTGWQAWEAHETRKEASEASAESLQVSQRAYIGVEGIAAPKGQPRLNIRTFGNSPAVGVFVESNCYRSSGGGSSSWGDGSIMKPEGEILTPGAPYSLDCYDASIKKRFAPPASTDFTYLRGTVNYQDIF